MPTSPEIVHGHIVNLSHQHSLNAALELFDALGYAYADELPLPTRTWPAGVQQIVHKGAEPPLYLARHRDLYVPA